MNHFKLCVCVMGACIIVTSWHGVEPRRLESSATPLREPQISQQSNYIIHVWWWESCADVNFSMNFKATGTAPCDELPCRIQEFGQGWRTLSERRVDRRWRTAHRWLAHCRRSPLLISGANSPLAVHMGNSTRPRPLATVINKNIMPVVMDFWRSTKLLADLCWQTDLLIRSLMLLAWLPF